MYAAMALTLTAISARCLTARTGTTFPLRAIPIPTRVQRAIRQGTIPSAHITMAQDTQFIQALVEASTITTVMETRYMFQSAGKGLFKIREEGGIIAPLPVQCHQAKQTLPNTLARYSSHHYTFGDTFGRKSVIHIYFALPSDSDKIVPS